MKHKGSLLIKVISFIVILLSNGISFNVFATESINPNALAQPLNTSATWKLNGKPAPKALMDMAVNTTTSIEAGTTLIITSSTKIQSIYVLYDNAPSLYTVTYRVSFDTNPESDDFIYKNFIQKAGVNGFLHELIVLKEPSSYITLKLPKGKLASIIIYSKGQLPNDVQQWKAPTKDADMLVLAAHGDDEALYFGPAIAMSVAQGRVVQVAYLINHFNDRRRPHETLDSLWELGVTAYPIFGPYKDKLVSTLKQAYAYYPKEEVLTYEIGLIRRFKPEVILSHDFAGEYGHGAHMLLSDVLKEAIISSNDPKIDPASASLYGTHDPLKTYIHLYKTNKIILDVYTPLAYFNNRSPLVVARAAYDKHISQHIWPLAVIVYSVGDVRRFGLYRSTVGLDTGNDLFEHIPKKPVIVKPDPPKQEIVPIPSDPFKPRIDLYVRLIIISMTISTVTVLLMLGLFTKLSRKNRVKH